MITLTCTKSSQTLSMSVETAIAGSTVKSSSVHQVRLREWLKVCDNFAVKFAMLLIRPSALRRTLKAIVGSSWRSTFSQLCTTPRGTRSAQRNDQIAAVEFSIAQQPYQSVQGWLPILLSTRITRLLVSDCMIKSSRVLQRQPCNHAFSATNCQIQSLSATGISEFWSASVHVNPMLVAACGSNQTAEEGRGRRRTAVQI